MCFLFQNSLLKIEQQLGGGGGERGNYLPQVFVWASMVHVLNVLSGSVLPSETAPHKARSGILWGSAENEAVYEEPRLVTVQLLPMHVITRRKSHFATDCLQVPTWGSW